MKPQSQEAQGGKAMAKPKVATVWLECCSGCHMSLLDLDEALVSVLSRIDLTVAPITDFKDYQFPQVDLGIIEGGLGNHEQVEIAKKLRESCTLLMALGDCAVFGGINAARNHIPVEELLRKGFVETASTVNGLVPHAPELPVLLDRVKGGQPGGGGGHLRTRMPAFSGGDPFRPGGGPGRTCGQAALGPASI